MLLVEAGLCFEGLLRVPTWAVRPFTDVLVARFWYLKIKINHKLVKEHIFVLRKGLAVTLSCIVCTKMKIFRFYR